MSEKMRLPKPSWGTLRIKDVTPLLLAAALLLQAVPALGASPPASAYNRRQPNWRAPDAKETKVLNLLNEMPPDRRATTLNSLVNAVYEDAFPWGGIEIQQPLRSWLRERLPN